MNIDRDDYDTVKKSLIEDIEEFSHFQTVAIFSKDYYGNVDSGQFDFIKDIASKKNIKPGKFFPNKN